MRPLLKAPLPGPVSHWLETRDGVRLHLLRTRGGPGAVRLLLPGFHRRAETWTHVAMAHRLATRGPTFALDFRGHGRSEGRYTFGQEEVADVEAALEALRAAGYREILVVALSMGGYLAIRTLGERPEAWPEVRGLVTISAPARWARVYPRLDLRIPLQVRLPPRERRWPPRIRMRSLVGARPEAAEVVHRLPCPLQIHHHRSDWLIASSHGEELARRAHPSREYHLYGGDGRVDHADNLVRRRFGEIMGRVETFLEACLEVPPGSGFPER